MIALSFLKSLHITEFPPKPKSYKKRALHPAFRRCDPVLLRGSDPMGQENTGDGTAAATQNTGRCVASAKTVAG